MMKQDFGGLPTIKFLIVNLIAITIASGVTYFTISPIASAHEILWVLAMPIIGLVVSLIQLLFIKSMVSKRGEWIGFNIAASIVWPLAVFVIGFIIAALLEKSKIYIPKSRYVWVVIGGFAGAIASSIITVGHWHILTTDNRSKIEWIISVVIVTSLISAFAGYAFTFAELAK